MPETITINGVKLERFEEKVPVPAEVLETFSYTPEQLRTLWDAFDTPLNYTTEENNLVPIPGSQTSPYEECIDEDYLWWKCGTPRAVILRWFDDRYPGGIHALIYGEKQREDERQALLAVGKEIRALQTDKTVESMIEAQFRHFVHLATRYNELIARMTEQIRPYQPELAQELYECCSATL